MLPTRFLASARKLAALARSRGWCGTFTVTESVSDVSVRALGLRKRLTDCARRSLEATPKDAGSIPATSTPRQSAWSEQHRPGTSSFHDHARYAAAQVDLMRQRRLGAPLHIASSCQVRSRARQVTGELGGVAGSCTTRTPYDWVNSTGPLPSRRTPSTFSSGSSDRSTAAPSAGHLIWNA